MSRYGLIFLKRPVFSCKVELILKFLAPSVSSKVLEGMCSVSELISRVLEDSRPFPDAVSRGITSIARTRNDAIISELSTFCLL